MKGERLIDANAPAVAAARGGSKDLDVRSTEESYLQASPTAEAVRTREAEVLDEAVSRILDLLAPLMLVEDEWGVRARRASEVLRARPVPEAVHGVLKAFSENLAAVIYGGASVNRSRVVRLINALVVEATRLEGARRAA